MVALVWYENKDLEILQQAFLSAHLFPCLLVTVLVAEPRSPSTSRGPLGAALLKLQIPHVTVERRVQPG